MTLRLDELYLGKVDGKFEYVTPLTERDETFYDAYLIPKAVKPENFGNFDRYFISGFRGTGKTSLLRWFGESRRKADCLTEFVLFKSEIPEEKRQNLSNEVGVTWVELDQSKMEFSQDFKAVWKWFILHKIGEALGRDDFVKIERDYDTYARLLGLKSGAFSKIMGFLPKLEKLNVSIKADLKLFEAELGGDFTKIGASEGKTSLSALNNLLLNKLVNFNFNQTIYILFDELEVFYSEESKYHRDQRMVRDLLFTISELNEIFRDNKSPIHILGAVRSEVLDAFGAIGQEVERVVHDKGIKLAWHSAKRSTDHPLFEIIAKKIKLSDASCHSMSTTEVMEKYFPAVTRGSSIDAYLLDRSFYKPRDLIWRLTLARDRFPDETRFTEKVLLDTEQDYSNEMWKEIKYELSANYAEFEINVIEMVLSGYSVEFELDDIEDRFKRFTTSSMHARKMLTTRGVIDILNDLYRLGAIGNYFREGTSSADIRNRWAFRGDPSLLFHKRMTINPSLIKRLSMVQARRRGSRGTGR